MCTGNLLAVLSKHYQQVNSVCFTDDGSHFISAGEDNLVFVWSLARYSNSSHHVLLLPNVLVCNTCACGNSASLLKFPSWFNNSVLSDSSAGGSAGKAPEPRHIWSQHSLPVTDVHVGRGGIRARVVTASLDQTVKVKQSSVALLMCL